MNRFGALRQLAARKGSSDDRSGAPEDGLGESLSRASAAIDEVVDAAERAVEGVRAEAEKRSQGKESVIDRDRVAAELMRSLAERTEALRAEAYELARVLERAAPLVASQGGGPDQATAQPASTPTLQGSKTVVSAAGTQSQPPPSAPPTASAPPQPPVVSEPEPAPAPVEPAPAVAEPEPASPAVAPQPTEPFAAVAPEPENLPAQAEELPPLSHREVAPHPSEGIRLLATQMAVAGSSHAEIEERLRSEFGVDDADEILAEVFGGPPGS